LRLSRKDYEAAVDSFLQNLKDRRETDPDAAQQLELLRVPMDAVIVSELLADGENPTPSRALDQLQARMEAAFKTKHLREFAREPWAERILQWRLSRIPYVDVTGFDDEAIALFEYKLMRRLDLDIQTPDGPRREHHWSFRHDLVMEHFLFPAFVGKGTARRWEDRHYGDERLWGLYRLLALRLPWPEARELERFLATKSTESEDTRLWKIVATTLRARSQREPEPQYPISVKRTINPSASNSMNDGLSVLSKSGGPCELDVVLIHGIIGDARMTWQHDRADAKTFWPDWLQEDCPWAHIWSLGFNAALSAWQQRSMPLADRGLNVLDQLYNAGLADGKPLVFITHSMGGLVVKQLLNEAESMGVSRYETIARSTVGIAFIGTPHSGANLASFLSFVNAALHANPTVRDMEQHSAELRKLHGWFLHYVTRQRLVCRSWCERLEVKPEIPLLGIKLPKGIIVVDETSGEPNIPGERAIPLDEDHISIAKVRDRRQQLYQGILRFLEDCRKRATVTE
jgi:hypothetical protein